MSNVKVKSYVPKAIKANTAGTADGLIKTAIKVTTQAKILADFEKGYQTGELKGSIMWKSTDKSGGFTKGDKLVSKPSKTAVIVGSGVEHATYIEFGTRKMAAQPYLRPAVDIVTKGTDAKKAMKDAMYYSVREALKRAGKL